MENVSKKCCYLTKNESKCKYNSLKNYDYCKVHLLQEIKKIIVANISDTTNLSVEQINKMPDNKSMADYLGIESLDFIEIVLSLESTFHFIIPDDDIEKLETMGQIVDYAFNCITKARLTLPKKITTQKSSVFYKNYSVNQLFQRIKFIFYKGYLKDYTLELNMKLENTLHTFWDLFPNRWIYKSASIPIFDSLGHLSEAHILFLTPNTIIHMKLSKRFTSFQEFQLRNFLIKSDFEYNESNSIISLSFICKVIEGNSIQEHNYTLKGKEEIYEGVNFISKYLELSSGI